MGDVLWGPASRFSLPPEPDVPEVSPMCGLLLWWGWFPAGTQAGQASQHGWLCNLSGPDCYKSHDCWWAVPAPGANMWERQFQHGAHQLRHPKNGCHQHLSSAGNPSCLRLLARLSMKSRWVWPRQLSSAASVLGLEARMLLDTPFKSKVLVYHSLLVLPNISSTSIQSQILWALELNSSCLENFMDREAWWATVHGVTESWTWPNDACACVHTHTRTHAHTHTHTHLV